MRSTTIFASLLVGLTIGVGGCTGGMLAGGAPATRAHYDKIKKGMTREDVDKALAELGPGQPTTAQEAAQAVGQFPVDTSVATVCSDLTLYKWGGGQAYLYAGFDKQVGKVRAKFLRSPDRMAGETYP